MGGTIIDFNERLRDIKSRMAASDLAEAHELLLALKAELLLIDSKKFELLEMPLSQHYELQTFLDDVGSELMEIAVILGTARAKQPTE